MSARFKGFVIGFLVCAAIVVIAGLLQAKPIEVRRYQVHDKYETDGRCFIEISVEVSPEDYIGLDQGDEYILEVVDDANY